MLFKVLCLRVYAAVMIITYTDTKLLFSNLFVGNMGNWWEKRKHYCSQSGKSDLECSVGFIVDFYMAVFLAP
jgi:hypothetical protein